MMKYFPGFTKFSSFFAGAEESNLYLTIGVVALFIGLYLFNQPLSLIILGIIFIVVSFIIAQQEGDNGTS